MSISFTEHMHTLNEAEGKTCRLIHGDCFCQTNPCSGKVDVLTLDRTRVLIRPLLCLTAGCNLNVHVLVSPYSEPLVWSLIRNGGFDKGHIVIKG